MGDVEVTVTIIGGPTVLIELCGVRLLTDPTFDPAGTTYERGPVHLAKTRGPAMSTAELGPLDAVLLSHDEHPDNLDAAGRELLTRVPLVLTTPAAAKRLGGNAVGLAPGETYDIAGPEGQLQVVGARAEHGPPSLGPALGSVTGFLVRTRPDSAAVYISGDNVSLEAAAEASRSGEVGLAVLHAGAARLQPFGPAPLSMTAADAANATSLLDAGAVIVVHAEGWNHLSEPDHAVITAFAAAGLGERLHTASPGQRVSARLRG
ncbi:MBL fold metallo-hydrolase [Micromonospora sp. NPDC050495]|uniref:MBL fold metallo-hydrolase n=1 Tax=Micromonospora sp. NPDC050495 TaxID=3154936 RepID=UPI00340A1E71